jgi:NADH:ubiquinone oxidoreductase subunit 2 (subunit N)
MAPCRYLLSLGGCPPFLGFGLKFLSLIRLLDCFWALVAVLLLRSAVRLYYYLVVFINSMVGLANIKHKSRNGLKYGGGWLRRGLLGLNVLGGLPLVYTLVFCRYCWLPSF